MDIVTDLLVAAGLSMDSAAASLVWGLGSSDPRRSAAMAALFFGGTQAAMFAAGGLGGEALKGAIEPIDHWIAFGLLCFIGAKMAISGLSGKGRLARSPDGFGQMEALAIATSIDAVVVGVGLALAGNSVWQTAAVVGLVTAAISSAGVLFGGYGGKGLGAKASLAGGIVLAAIGLRILLSDYGF